MKISTVIITLNEASHIGECVRSAMQVSDEVIVIDAESMDDTVEIAKANGAKVIIRPWEGYGKAKNFGHSICRNDWVLSLDGDEVLSESFIRQFNQMTLGEKTVYEIDIQTDYFGKWLKHSGFYPLWKKRLFNKKYAHWDEKEVHETLISKIEYSKQRIQGKVYHYSFKSREQYRKKLDSYARLGAMQWIKNGERPGIMKRLFGPSFRFFKTYILQLGILDGKAGWEISMMNMEANRAKLRYFEELK